MNHPIMNDPEWQKLCQTMFPPQAEQDELIGKFINGWKVPCTVCGTPINRDTGYVDGTGLLCHTHALEIRIKRHSEALVDSVNSKRGKLKEVA